jgi:hypothetical protein
MTCGEGSGALKPIYDTAGIDRLVISTYQERAEHTYAQTLGLDVLVEVRARRRDVDAL